MILANIIARPAVTDPAVPVAALHGSAATGRQWAGLAAYLGEEFRFLAPDTPGYGSSAGWDAGARISMADRAERIAALLVACGRPVHLVGHSAGGALALKVALDRPDLVASLTLIEPVAFHLLGQAGSAEGLLLDDIRWVAETMRQSADGGNPALGMAHFVNYWNGSGYWLSLPADTRLRLAGQCGQVIEDFRATFAEDWPLAKVGDLTMPVQLIMGLQSQPPALRITEMLAETIDGARLSVLPDAGHLAPFSHPSAVHPTIVRHIRMAEAGADEPNGRRAPADRRRAA
jgi:pimeloyl-ACP methyl ester carboxylesterase